MFMKFVGLFEIRKNYWKECLILVALLKFTTIMTMISITHNYILDYFIIIHLSVLKKIKCQKLFSISLSVCLSLNYISFIIAHLANICS